MFQKNFQVSSAMSEFKLLLLTSMTVISALSTVSCSPRDVDPSNGSLDCFQDSKGKTKCKPKAGTPGAQVNPDGSPIAGKNSQLDDFSLAVHTLERTAEVGGLLQAALGKSRTQSLAAEPIAGNPSSSTTVEVITNQDDTANVSAAGPQANWNGKWILNFTKNPEGQITSIDGQAQSFQWSGRKNDSQLVVIEKGKSFSLQRKAKSNNYSFYYHSPVSFMLSKGPERESSHFEIEVRGFVSMNESGSQMIFDHVSATAFFEAYGKMLNIDTMSDLTVDLDPCLKITGQAVLSRQGEDRKIPIDLRGTSIKVDGKPDDPKKGWKQEYSNCSQGPERPVLDFLRLIRDQKPNSNPPRK